MVPLVVAAACGGSGDESSDTSPATEPAITTATTTAAADTTTPPATAAPTTPPAATTTAATTTTTPPSTTTTVAPATTSTAPATTTTVPPDDVDLETACATWLGELSELLAISADLLLDGADLTQSLVDGTLTEPEAAPLLADLSGSFDALRQRLDALGTPPPSTLPATTLFEEQLAGYVTAFELQAQGAAGGDQALIDAGANELATAATLSSQIVDALPDCAAVGAEPAGPVEFATPDEMALTVFFSTAESLFSATDSPYAGTADDVLIASAQASCRVLLDGGDIRSAIEAAIAASPVAGQPFGSSEQQFVLFVVTRGADLWCPSIVGDTDTFRENVISTIVDVFFDG